MVELRSVVKELEKWKEGKGLILRGQDGNFCSGADLDFVLGIMDSVKGAKMCLFMQNTVTRLQNLPLVSVALIQGRALGGGAELTTSTDFRLITENGKVGFIQVKMGVSPGWGGGARLVNIVGQTKAMELLVSGRILAGNEAVECGLASDVLNDANAVTNAEEWLTKTLVGTAYVTQALKKIVVYSVENDLQSALKKEKDIFASLWSGPAHAQAVNARHKH